MRTLALAAALLVWLCGTMPRTYADDLAAMEAKARGDDLAAVNSFKAALVRLNGLLRSNKNPQQESILTMRIAETLNRMAAIQFRLSHGPTGASSLNEYRSTLNQIISSMTVYLQKFPKSQDVARAVFLRAKAYKELERDPDAIRDFRYLIDNFRNNADLANAELSLYDLLIKAKDFTTAIRYMKGFQVSPADSFYPLVLDHIGFAYFFLNQIPEAIQNLQMELAQYPLKQGASKAEYADREKVLQNIALFYFTGQQNRTSGYTTAAALPYFKRLNLGPSQGKILTFYANLLRSKGLDNDLEAFKAAAIASGIGPAETMDLVFAIFENQLNKRRYSQLRESAEEMNRVVAKAGYQKGDPKAEKAQKVLADAAKSLQQTFIKYKDTAEGAQITPTLIAIYNIMLKTSDNQANNLKVRFNLAETLFMIKNYEGAVAQYRWIAENGSGLPGGPALVDQSLMKAITARYEVLNAKQAFPKALAPKAIAAPPSQPVAPEIAQWITWLDQYPANKDRDALEVYIFEADRLLYSQGRIEEALKRLAHLVKTSPKSKFLIPAASLVLDTYVASERWEETYDIANEYLKTIDPSKTDFRARLQTVSADSFFKTTESLYKKGSYAEVLTRADGFMKMFPTSKRKSDCLALAANAALATKDKKRALGYFAQDTRPELAGTALLTRAAVAEESYDFDGAAGEYRKYLTLPAQQRAMSADELKNMRTKELLLSWLSGKSTTLKQTLAAPYVCTADQAEACERYTALEGFMEPGRASDHALTHKAVDRARKLSGPTRAIWAALALENPKAIGFNDRLQLMDIAAADWGKLDSLSKYAVLPYISISLAESLKQSAAEVRAMSHVKLAKAEISKRVNLIEKVEGGIQKATELPWAHIRALAINEWANLYADFSKEILALPKPAGLAAEDLAVYNQTVEEMRAPFAKKVTELRKQAFDLAVDAGIETDAFVAIAFSYYNENPTAPRDIKTDRFPPRVPVADASVFEHIGAPQDWAQSNVRAAREGNWAKISYLLQDATDKKLLNEGQLAAARAASLCLAGAQAEGLAQFAEASPKLDRNQRAYVLLPMAAGYYGARSKLKTKAAIEEIAQETQTQERQLAATPAQSAELAEAVTWSMAEVSADLKQEFAQSGSRAPASTQGGKR